LSKPKLTRSCRAKEERRYLEYINAEESHVPLVGEVVIPGLFAVFLSVASLQSMNYERRLTVSKNTIQLSVDII
jgi:hypothetical protein